MRFTSLLVTWSITVKWKISISATIICTSSGDSGYNLVEPTIAGVMFDDLALRSEDEEIQLWIAKGSKLGPCRMVVTYKRGEGHP